MALFNEPSLLSAAVATTCPGSMAEIFRLIESFALDIVSSLCSKFHIDLFVKSFLLHINYTEQWFMKHLHSVPLKYLNITILLVALSVYTEIGFRFFSLASHFFCCVRRKFVNKNIGLLRLILWYTL